MGELVSQEVRELLGNPATRHRVVEAWIYLKRQEQKEARRAAKPSGPSESRGVQTKSGSAASKA